MANSWDDNLSTEGQNCSRYYDQYKHRSVKDAKLSFWKRGKVPFKKLEPGTLYFGSSGKGEGREYLGYYDTNGKTWLSDRSGWEKYRPRDVSRIEEIKVDQQHITKTSKPLPSLIGKKREIVFLNPDGGYGRGSTKQFRVQERVVKLDEKTKMIWVKDKLKTHKIPLDSILDIKKI